jgi:hypothetical protein
MEVAQRVDSVQPRAGDLNPEITNPQVGLRSLNQLPSSPDAQEHLATLNPEPSSMSPQQFATFQAAEIVKWAKAVKAINVKVA